MNTQRERIRLLNDQLRSDFSKGRAVITRGVAELDGETIARIINAVAIYDAFSEDNDPYGEHDFGSCEIDGQKIFWKIDYYDLALSMHSPDPADPSVTERVITIMLADEY
jgi:hypothetical protein